MRSTTTSFAFLAVGILTVGCGGGSTDADAGTSLDAMTLDAPPVGCAADEHDAGAGCDTAIGWAPGPDLATPRDHHETFVVDPGGSAARFLYVAGGFAQATSTLLSSVVRAPLHDDGTLGAWEDVAPLTAPVGGAGVVVTHGEVIFVGGFGSAATWVAKVQADGSLGTWTAGPALSGNRFHATAVTYGDFVYLVGGLNGTMTSDEVQRTTIASDGSLSPWEVVAHLPYSLSYHSAVVDGATLYVIAGQTGNTNDNSGMPHREVQLATLGADGSVGAWSTGPALPVAFETHASIVHDGFVYVVGGIVDPTSHEADGVATPDVLRADIQAPGMLGDWEIDDASVLPAARSHVHQVPVWGSHVYSVSGLQDAADTAAVFVGTFH